MGQVEKYQESRLDKEKEALFVAVYGGLEKAVERAGGILVRVAVNFGPVDCLIVISAEFPGGRMIAFVGSEDLAQGLVKATREASRDQLRWKPDEWAKS
ncbi:MAG: hypothetical protein WBF55_21495 [Syntrophobacteria bacterium]